MSGNPYEQYQKQAVMTMTQGEVVVKLFDECLKQLNAGKHYIQEKNIEMANNCLKKAHQILSCLRLNLNMKYEISENLSSLYDYYIQRIITANIKKDVAPIDEVFPMITDLRNSFFEAEKLVRIK
jgi:flagellar protein FliS